MRRWRSTLLLRVDRAYLSVNYPKEDMIKFTSWYGYRIWCNVRVWILFSSLWCLFHFPFIPLRYFIPIWWTGNISNSCQPFFLLSKIVSQSLLIPRCLVSLLAVSVELLVSLRELVHHDFSVLCLSSELCTSSPSSANPLALAWLSDPSWVQNACMQIILYCTCNSRNKACVLYNNGKKYISKGIHLIRKAKFSYMNHVLYHFTANDRGRDKRNDLTFKNMLPKKQI